MSRNLGRKILTAIALVAIVVQSFSPYVAILPQKAYAQEVTQAVDQTTPTPTDTATPTPTVDQTTPTDTVTPTPVVTVEPTPTPTVDEAVSVTPTPVDNNSPPANNNSGNQDNSNSSNDNPTTPTVTPEASATPTPTPTETTTGNEQISMTILKNVSAPTVNLDFVIEEGSASLTTDKPDYAPTDTALITGSNLLQNTNYSLTISSADDPATSTTVNVTSDDKGVFAYAYQLDGKYRPNYKAQLKDETGAVVASTTFTDAAVGYVLTNPATGVTTTDATLNGHNGGTAATGHSFWVSLNTFLLTSSTIPSSVYSTPDLGSIAANTDFSASLASITTTGVPTNLPAVTPNTTYYFAAWSLVSGTWQHDTIRTFTTLPGPVFIDTNVNGVLDPGEQSFNTIQAAINAAASGNTIHVTAGTYTEIGQIVINKNLSIVGADKTTTTIKPNFDTSNSGDGKGWFLVNDGITFNLSKVTLDGNGHQIFQAIRDYGSGAINNVIFTNIQYEPSTSYAGTGVVAFGGSGANVNITNSLFDHIGRVGVLFYGTGQTGTFDHNTYTGKGAGNWLDYGVELGAGANATISNSTFSDCTGVATVDGSTSAGIIATTYYGGGTQATITGNTVAGNTDGIGVGYDASDTSVVVAHSNNLSGNIEHGVISTNPTVDATNNWWGNASGPYDNKTLPGSPNYNNPSGTGSPVSSYVDYKPWFTDSAMTTLASPNAITDAATGMGLYGATLNGTNGDYDASNTSFWWGTTSAGPFTACASCISQFPSGWTHDTGLGAESAGHSFSEPLTGLTSGTPYYFVAWSEVGGTWYPGAVQSFTTNPLVLPKVPTNGQPSNSHETTNNFYFTWSDSTGTYPVTYEFQSSGSSNVDGNGSLINAWNSIANGNSEQNHLTSPTIHSTGAPDGTYYWQVRAIDSHGNTSAWSDIWNVTLVTTGTITVDKITNPSQSSQVFQFYLRRLSPTPVVILNTFTLTDQAAPYVNSTIVPGSYSLSEDTVQGWRGSSPVCYKNGESSPIQLAVGSQAFNVAAGDSIVCTFNNIQYGSITAYKYLDANENGIKDTGEAPLSGWRISLYTATDSQCADTDPSAQLTGSDGNAVINSVVPGTYYLKEETRSGWATKQSSCRQITVSSGQNALMEFGNYQLDTTPPSVVLTDNHPDSIVRDADTVVITATFTEADQIDETTPPTISINSVGIVNNAPMTKVSNKVWTYSWNVPAGNDGTHTVSISAHDRAGNANSAATGKTSYTIDNTAPTISAAVSAGTLGSNGWYTSNVTVHFTCSDTGGSGIASCPANQILNTQGSSVSSTAQTATDNAGNTSTSSNVVTVKIDKTNPTNLWITPLNGDYVKGVVNLSVDASDIISGIDFVRFRYGVDTNHLHTISEDTTSPYETAWDTTGLSDGSYILRAHAVDNSGRTKNADITVTIDNTAPATPSASPAAGDYNSDQSVTLSSSDLGSGLDKIYYTTDGSVPNNSKTEYSGVITVDKDMTIKAIAYDKVGNASDVLTAVYGIAPIISLEGSVSISETSATITWTTDDLSTSRVVYDTVSRPDPVISSGESLDKYHYANTTDEFDTGINKTTSHSVGLTGLSSGTTYYYRVISHGSPEAIGDEKTFTTSNPPNPGGPGDGLGCGSHGCGGGANASAGQVLGAFTAPAVLGLAFAPGALNTQGEQGGQVLGTESANPAPSISPTVNHNPVSSFMSWALGYMQIALVILIILAVIAYWLYRKKRNK